MRDISPRQQPKALKSTQPRRSEDTPSRVGFLTKYIHKSANWFNSLPLTSYTPEVTATPIHSYTQHHQLPVTEPNQSTTKKRTTSGKKTPHKVKLRASARKAGTVIKKAAKSAISSPAGRYAVIQGFIGIALIGMAYNTFHQKNPDTKAYEQRNIGQTTVKQISRYQFLPTPQAYVPPVVFNASTSRKDHSNIQFDTWITPWNSAAISSSHDTYQTLSAFWLTVKENGYDVEPKATWEVWDSYFNTHPQTNHSYYLTVSGDPNHTFLALSDPNIQKKHIAQLLENVKTHHFDGIDIDYEALGDENQILFADFVRNLTDTFHKENKKVAVTVEARIGQQHPMDWQQLSQIADEVKIMLYDYHSSKTDIPGAISPIGWLKETLDFASTRVAKDKLVIGLGNYGYDWTEPADPTQSWQGIGISFESAIALSQAKGVEVQRAKYIDRRGYDMGLAPYFAYTDENQKKHEVWFEDHVSIKEKLDLIATYNIKSVTFWSVGALDPRIKTGQTQ